MTDTFDLVLLSAYGRGNWMATELASRGWRVALLDVTSKLPQTSWEDVEGPFGLLEPEDLLPSQRKRLADDGDLVAVSGGFTMWLQEGPLELRSELTSFLVRARSISTEAETYVREVKPTSGEGARRALTKLMYTRNWFAGFSHAFSARGHSENHTALENGGPASPLFSPYSIRRATAEGHARGLKVAEASGVSVRANVMIKELSSGTGGQFESVEIESASFSGTVRGRAFVCCLSFDETVSLGGGLGLYPKGSPKAIWSWERVRLSMEAPPAVRTSLPAWICTIDDVDLAWTRANMSVVRRTATGDALDVWLKVPAWMREEPPAFAAVVNDIAASLAKRLPQTKLQVRDLPRASRVVWPVFESNEEEIATLKSKNLYYSAPGTWVSCDWLGRFRHESEIVARLEKMKAQWDAAQRKQAAREERGARP